MVKKVFGNATKWTESIKNQLEDLDTESINTQYIRLDHIVLDPKNSRTISITVDEIKNGPKIPPGSFDELAQQTFQNIVAKYFDNDLKKEQKINDYLSLANFAASIKHPKNLINPITVYMKDMSFYLIAGHRRTLAHHMLGVERICAKIMDKEPTELDISVLQWGENQDRADLELKDQLTSLNRIVSLWENFNNKTITLNNMMSLLGLKKTKAVWFLKLYRCKYISLLDAINRGSITSIELAYKLACVDTEIDRENAITKAAKGDFTNPRAIKIREVRSPNQEFPSKKFMAGNTASSVTASIDLNIKNKNGEKILEFILGSIEISNMFKGFALNKYETSSLRTKWNLVCAFAKQKIDEKISND